MKLVLPKWRKGAWRAYSPFLFIYATTLSATVAIFHSTDNPWLFFWLYLSGLLLMHHCAFAAGRWTGIDEAVERYAKTTAMIDRMMSKDSLAAVQTIIANLGRNAAEAPKNDKR